MTCPGSEFGDCCGKTILGEKVNQKVANGATDDFVSQQSTNIGEMGLPFAAQETAILDPVEPTMEAHR
ncbi:hypothetical protein N7463_010178 [Penicillium fimorum]|uniref:Uncharacterized protein n=1 Tax=Penicillium fimorum TaxID=1882269 RepID=A0A9W9XJG1_9EURO|nr:hypothetical protein N7463_010178 [Penicillium fimorum]